MQRGWGVVSLLVLILMVGCAHDAELQALQSGTTAIKQQSQTHHQTIEARVQQLNDRVTRFERAQAAIRLEVARVAATVDELRSTLQNLQGAMQETEHHMQRGAAGEDGASATKLANVETRMRTLENQLYKSP